MGPKGPDRRLLMIDRQQRLDDWLASSHHTSGLLQLGKFGTSARFYTYILYIYRVYCSIVCLARELAVRLISRTIISLKFNA